MGIFLTSGTTSFPKGICHDTENLIKNALEFNRKIILMRIQDFIIFFQ